MTKKLKKQTVEKMVMAHQEFRPSMQFIWMELAELLKSRSTCSRLKVGSVITSKDLSRVYSVGYNGGATGQKNECESLEPGQCGHLHSEINAMIKCQVNDSEKVLFVTTFPCDMCAKALINSKFSKIYFKENYRNSKAESILNKANIIYEKL